MNYHLSIIISCLFLVSCSQIDAPREEPDGGKITPASTSNPSGGKDLPASQSTRKEYRKAYNLFKVHHRNVFELVNENKFALRNEGQKSVQAAEDMLSMLSNEDQSDLEDVFNNYQEAWDGFDQKSPSVGERNRLKSAGKKIRKEFHPENVRLTSATVSDPEKTKTQDQETSQGHIERDTTRRKINVKNSTRYRELFERWKRTHKQFLEGLENDDPLIKSSFQDLKSIIQSMVTQVESGKGRLKNYYLSQYELIFSKRDQYAGTPAKSDHLTYLQRQFEQDFKPVSE